MTPLDDDSADDDYSIGDGDADTEATVRCPYCGESVEIILDPGSGEDQQYVEDCESCAEPWQVHVSYDLEGHADVVVTKLDE